ncbi:MAG: two-component system response regulator NarL [Pseudomonadales bacterium]
MISILLVDDHPMLRQGVAQLIELEEELSVVGQAGDGLEAIKLAELLDPDMILLDLNMEGMGGLETLAVMRSKGITSSILVFTVSDDHDDVIGSLRAGADGYLLKDSEPEELLAAIKRAGQGQQVFSPQLAQIMAQALRKPASQKVDLLAQLTPRELEILRLLGNGRANKEIGRQLIIAESTVKVHVKNLLKKLSLRSRLEAGLWAVENNILSEE